MSDVQSNYDDRTVQLVGIALMQHYLLYLQCRHGSGYHNVVYLVEYNQNKSYCNCLSIFYLVYKMLGYHL